LARLLSGGLDGLLHILLDVDVHRCAVTPWSVVFLASWHSVYRGRRAGVKGCFTRARKNPLPREREGRGADGSTCSIGTPTGRRGSWTRRTSGRRRGSRPRRPRRRRGGPWRQVPSGRSPQGPARSSRNACSDRKSTRLNSSHVKI